MSSQKVSLVLATAILLLLLPQATRAQSESTALPKFDTAPLFAELHQLAASEEILQAVRAHNKGLTPEYRALDNTKWKSLSPRSDLVMRLAHNATADFLRNHIKKYVSEVFVSGIDGKKVAFLAKTTSWDHSGTPKHELPMKGKDWTGKVELDESAGINQLQISAPVLDQGIPIGSIVFGLSAVRLNGLSQPPRQQ